MSRILYLTSSSYSGSTLLTFLVNQHPELFTIGELEGWDYGDEEYRCSCGALIEDCKFFQYVRVEYEKAGLAFSTRNFHTKLRLSDNKHFNRYLTSAIPHMNYSAVEKIRDTILWNVPGLRRRFNNAVMSNSIFVRSALEYDHASVFVDATKNPFRLRMLRRATEFDLNILYMVRDIRGVVASNIRKKNISVAEAATQWLTEQDNILRVIREFPQYMLIHYEDLCARPNDKLSQLYSYLNVRECPFVGNIREGEHHILGNAMRIGNVNEIRLDERSKTELSEQDTEVIEKTAKRYLETRRNQGVHDLVLHYLNRL